MPSWKVALAQLLHVHVCTGVTFFLYNAVSCKLTHKSNIPLSKINDLQTLPYIIGTYMLYELQPLALISVMAGFSSGKINEDVVL